MTTWADEINSRINNNLEKSREKDIRFFRIDEFKRNIVRVDEFSEKCAFCNKQKVYIAEAADTIREAVNVPGNERRRLDWLTDSLSKHMRKEHGFYPPYYHSYLYSFLGIAAGTAIGFVLYKLFPDHGDTVFSGSFMIGIVTSYIAGSRKDFKVRRAKKIM